MISNVTFDTLEYSNELKRSGIPEQQAEAITKATSNALQQVLDSEHLATKKDIQEIKSLIHAITFKTITYVSMIQGTVITLCQYLGH